MANPTQQVPTESTPFSEEKVYWPANPALTSDVVFTGEMIGMRADTGFAEHFDDAAPKFFLGTKEQIASRFQSDTPATDFKLLIRKPQRFSMPLNTSVTATATIPSSIGQPAYASDSGHVQLSTSGLTNNNLAGMVVDISRSFSQGSSGGVLSLTTANTTPAVVIEPTRPGALAGLLVQGFAGADSQTANGGNAPPMFINTGRGGNATVGTNLSGGNAAALIITCGTGGSKTGTGTAGTDGFVQMASPSGTTAGGLVVGAATGGNKGAGTINVSTSIQLNGTAYTNPGFVFEKWLTGKVVRFADQKGAPSYAGVPSLEEIEQCVRETYDLPGMNPEHDLFRRAAFTLVKLEELYIHFFDMAKRVAKLESAAAA